MTTYRGMKKGGLVDRLWEAQGKLCPVCGDQLFRKSRRHFQRGWSLEHVWPKSRYAYHASGNLLVSHVACNNGKADRDPTGCEVIMLHAANARLGADLIDRQSSYVDVADGPGVLALAFQRAGPQLTFPEIPA